MSAPTSQCFINAAHGNTASLRTWLSKNTAKQNAKSGGTTEQQCNSIVDALSKDAERGQASLLYVAARNGHLSTVTMLVNEFGANVNNKNGANSSTPLHGAAYGGFAEVLEFLLAKGADASAVNTWGDSALDDAKAAPGTSELSKQRCVALLQNKGLSTVDTAAQAKGASAAAAFTRSELMLRTVAQLRALCDDAGLCSDGVKAVLVDRILAATGGDDTKTKPTPTTTPSKKKEGEKEESPPPLKKLRTENLAVVESGSSSATKTCFPAAFVLPRALTVLDAKFLMQAASFHAVVAVSLEDLLAHLPNFGYDDDDLQAMHTQFGIKSSLPSLSEPDAASATSAETTAIYRLDAAKMWQVVHPYPQDVSISPTEAASVLKEEQSAPTTNQFAINLKTDPFCRVNWRAECLKTMSYAEQDEAAKASNALKNRLLSPAELASLPQALTCSWMTHPCTKIGSLPISVAVGCSIILAWVARKYLISSDTHLKLEESDSAELRREIVVFLEEMLLAQLLPDDVANATLDRRRLQKEILASTVQLHIPNQVFDENGQLQDPTEPHEDDVGGEATVTPEMRATASFPFRPTKDDHPYYEIVMTALHKAWRAQSIPADDAAAATAAAADDDATSSSHNESAKIVTRILSDPSVKEQLVLAICKVITATIRAGSLHVQLGSWGQPSWLTFLWDQCAARVDENACLYPIPDHFYRSRTNHTREWFSAHPELSQRYRPALRAMAPSAKYADLHPQTRSFVYDMQEASGFISYPRRSPFLHMTHRLSWNAICDRIPSLRDGCVMQHQYDDVESIPEELKEKVNWEDLTYEEKFTPQHGDHIDFNDYRGTGLFICYGPSDDLQLIKTEGEYGYNLPMEFSDGPQYCFSAVSGNDAITGGIIIPPKFLHKDSAYQKLFKELIAKYRRQQQPDEEENDEEEAEEEEEKETAREEEDEGEGLDEDEGDVFEDASRLDFYDDAGTPKLNAHKLETATNVLYTWEPEANMIATMAEAWDTWALMREEQGVAMDDCK